MKRKRKEEEEKEKEKRKNNNKKKIYLSGLERIGSCSGVFSMSVTHMCLSVD